MTDERRPDEPTTPDQGTPPNPSAPEPPPPLAPLVAQAGQAADDASADAAPTRRPSPRAAGRSLLRPRRHRRSRRQRCRPRPCLRRSPPSAGRRPRRRWPSRAGERPLSLVAGILLIIGGILGGLAGLAVAVFGNAIVQSLEDFGRHARARGRGHGSVHERLRRLLRDHRRCLQPRVPVRGDRRGPVT